MKICKNCKKEKSLENFTKCSSLKDGRRNECKNCYTLKYYGRNLLKEEYNSKSFKSIEYKDGTKYCTKCKNIKPKNEFLIKNKKTGLLTSFCSNCYYVNQKNQTYGILPEEYNQMLISQNNKCKICNGINNSKKALFIDHCHITGKIRGLLCHKCNAGIGMFNDNIDLLKLTITYLVENK